MSYAISQPMVNSLSGAAPPMMSLGQPNMGMMPGIGGMQQPYVSDVDVAIADANAIASQGNAMMSHITAVDQTFSQQQHMIQQLQQQNQQLQMAMASGGGMPPGLGVMTGGTPGAIGADPMNPMMGTQGATNPMQQQLDVATANGDPVALVKSLELSASNQANDMMAQMQQADMQYKMEKAMKSQIEGLGVDPETFEGRQLLNQMKANGGQLPQMPPQMPMNLGMGGMVGGPRDVSEMELANALAMADPNAPSAHPLDPRQLGLQPQEIDMLEQIYSLNGTPNPMELGGQPPVGAFGAPLSGIGSPSAGPAAIGEMGGLSPMDVPGGIGGYTPEASLAPAPGGGEEMIDVQGTLYPKSMVEATIAKLEGRSHLEEMLESGKIDEGTYQQLTGGQSFKGVDLSQFNSQNIASQISAQGQQASAEGDRLTPEQMTKHRIQKARNRMKNAAQDIGGSPEDLAVSAYSTFSPSYGSGEMY